MSAPKFAVVEHNETTRATRLVSTAEVLERAKDDVNSLLKGWKVEGYVAIYELRATASITLDIKFDPPATDPPKQPSASGEST